MPEKSSEFEIVGVFTFGLGLVLGFLLGASTAFLHAQTIEPVLVDETPVAFSLSRDVAESATAIMASTSLDILSATDISLARMASQPQTEAILERLDIIIKLLHRIAQSQ